MCEYHWETNPHPSPKSHRDLLLCRRVTLSARRIATVRIRNVGDVVLSLSRRENGISVLHDAGNGLIDGVYDNISEQLE